MNDKEHNFISAIVYVTADDEKTVSFFRSLHAEMERLFNKYEFIAVNAACASHKLEKLKEWSGTVSAPLTVINMSMEQSKEAGMNAGIDCAIGDYVYEFDTTSAEASLTALSEAYNLALQGNDIVSVCPTRQRVISSLFYALFNYCSRSAYPIRTEIFKLVSRRAVNRVHATSEYLEYRKAAYAASGLKMACIETKSATDRQEFTEGASLAVNSLLMYTGAGYVFSVSITMFALLVAVSVLIYTITVYMTGNPVPGWTTLMLVLAFCFSGLFIIFSIVIKYLALILEFSTRKQRYLVENVEKIQR